MLFYLAERGSLDLESILTLQKFLIFLPLAPLSSASDSRLKLSENIGGLVDSVGWLSLLQSLVFMNIVIIVC